ncbi:hypothetical protein G6F23_012898 [Rhizopus arrhizus]|nr:hypothetical protein G6F23_012898 [Rhizopus arrhizus]
MRCTISNPRPPFSPRRAPSAAGAWNSCVRSAGATPGPSSATLTSTLSGVARRHWSAHARPGPGLRAPAAGPAGSRHAGAGCAPARPARTSAARPAAAPATRRPPTPGVPRHAPAAPARTARAPADRPWRSAPGRCRGSDGVRPVTAWRPSTPAFPDSHAATTTAYAGHARCWPPARAAAGPAGAAAAIVRPAAAPSARARAQGSPARRARRGAAAPVAAVASVRRCRRPGCAGSAAAAGGSPSRTPPARPAGRGCQPASPTTRWCSTGYRRRGRRPASAGARRPAPRTRNPPDGPARSTARH